MQELWFSDWRSLMGAVSHWLAGGNPYGAFTMAGGMAYEAGWYAYPPPTLLLAAPLALLPWQLGGLLVQLLAIVGFERWARRSSGRMALPWLILWLPLLQGLFIGQTTLLALVGLMLAEESFRAGRDRRAALLLALCLLKPQATILAASWLLGLALWQRRWRLLVAFGALCLLLWGGAALVAGPAIYLQWYEGLNAYRVALPDRPLIAPPFGPLLGLLALGFWWRAGRGDHFAAFLLLNTLIYPLSVVYIAVGLAFVVIRWRPDWPWYPLLLSWTIPAVFILGERTADSIAGLTQAIIATGLLAGLLPRLPLPRLATRWPLGTGSRVAHAAPCYNTHDERPAIARGPDGPRA